MKQVQSKDNETKSTVREEPLQAPPHRRMNANYRISWIDDLAQIDATAWDALLQEQDQPTPFMKHAYLLAMQRSASACAKTGWYAQFLLLHNSDQTLCAACPIYFKNHSYGEYVFDWSWAQAYARHGVPYYPKAVVAIPFTPVPGSRLLARTPQERIHLLEAILNRLPPAGLSSLHVLLGSAADQATITALNPTEHDESEAAPTFIMRSGVQFHWQRSHMPDVVHFDDFLAQLQRKKRKNIVQERRQVAQANIQFQVRSGQEITALDWQYFYPCYAHTYHERGNPPYLQPEFFQELTETWTPHWLMVQAWHPQANEPIACALLGLDHERRRLFGRYWGRNPRWADTHWPGLHFETCYYQPLIWALAHGIDTFEGGAQGEHKLARGFLPCNTWSAHHIEHPEFALAIDQAMRHEHGAMQAYQGELENRNPLRSTAEWRSTDAAEAE